MKMMKMMIVIVDQIKIDVLFDNNFDLKNIDCSKFNIEKPKKLETWI
jgi:hypothetical protein